MHTKPSIVKDLGEIKVSNLKCCSYLSVMVLVMVYSLPFLTEFIRFDYVERPGNQPQERQCILTTGMK